MARTVFFLHIVAKAVVGDDTVDGAKVAVFNEFADLDAKGEKAGPYGFHEEQVLRFRRFD